jgi:hypothetical protein
MRLAWGVCLCTVGLCVAIVHASHHATDGDPYVSTHGSTFRLGYLLGHLVESVTNKQNVAPYHNKYKGRTGVLLANGGTLNRCVRVLPAQPTHQLFTDPCSCLLLLDKERVHA